MYRGRKDYRTGVRNDELDALMLIFQHFGTVLGE